MDWSRLGGATLDALLVSFVVGAVFAPPDPFTQLVALPVAFLIVVPLTYRYEPQIYARSWNRHVAFAVAVLAVQFGWNLLVRPTGLAPSLYSPLRLFVFLGSVALAGWLAYFGGLERIRASDGATTVAVAVPTAFVLAALFAPNPTRLLVFAAGLLVVTTPVSYYLVADRGT